MTFITNSNEEKVIGIKQTFFISKLMIWKELLISFFIFRSAKLFSKERLLNIKNLINTIILEKKATKITIIKSQESKVANKLIQMNGIFRS